MALSMSDFAGDGTRLQSFKHGEAPEEEREWRTFVPLPNEVEFIRKSESLAGGKPVFWTQEEPPSATHE